MNTSPRTNSTNSINSAGSTNGTNGADSAAHKRCDDCLECTAPITFIIFGGTGDLAEKKIFPALFGLYMRGMVGRAGCPFGIVVVGRRPLGDEGIRDHISAALTAHTPREWHDQIPDFASVARYHQGSIEETATFTRLAGLLGELDGEFGKCSHKIFHFSVAPQLYEPLLLHFEESGLNISCVDSPGKTRAVLEKPIGIDAASADHINTLLARVFTEEQVFRIDHYLMKSAVWDMKTLEGMLRAQGADSIGKKVSKILVRLWETKDVAGRGAFYDKIGALRDVGQNHMLQMLALFLGAKNPSDRAALIASLNPDAATVAERGQVAEYHSYKGIEPGSETETYFAIGAKALSPEAKYPIILSAGKSLARAAVEVGILYEDGTAAMQDVASAPHIGQSEAGERDVEHLERPIDGYERAFRDVLIGDHERFVSEAEIAAGWKFTDAARAVLAEKPLVKYGTDFTPKW